MSSPKDIVMKRAYDAAAPEDGYRALVDRLWPRGRSKDTLKLDEWAKSLAPSETVRKAYCHDPACGTISAKLTGMNWPRPTSRRGCRPCSRPPAAGA